MASYVRNDAFGRPTKIVGLKKNKKGFPTGYIEIGNSLYKIDVSSSKKDGVELWVKFTKLPARKNNFCFNNTSF